jgi:site-specific DNA-methyltransferase (adenine-specific)
MLNFENGNSFELYNGDCLEIMRSMPDNSIDSIVTDPPYGLSFMGKKWDYDVPSVEIWAECLRVLKPGGHLLAFAGTRTQHRMAVRIEDAGFEIRDMIAWVYGSGFPKSLDVSKAIDKAAGAERDVIGVREDFAKRMSLSKRPGTANVGGYVNPQAAGEITATDDARQWHGWGTALKPALEPITVARKPLIGTVVANVLEHGTGALNIDGCRVATNESLKGGGSPIMRYDGQNDRLCWGEGYTRKATEGNVLGRWPANLIHDGSDEVVAGFPQSQVSGSAKNGKRSDATPEGIFGKRPQGQLHNDTGSAARFFYCAKASKKDRGEGNAHPTVKPTDLMAYLCRLVTPPGGVVLDPFMGSGSTGKAAQREGFRFIGIEREPAYMEIANSRIRRVEFPGPESSIEMLEPSPDDITSLFV